MKDFLKNLIQIDRRWIFLLMAVVVIIPIYHAFNFPGLSVTKEVKGIYDSIENLPPRSVVLISMDFDPASMPELKPMAIGVVRHCFRKDLRVIGMGLWITGIGLAEDVFATTAQEFDKKRGVDYVFLGWKPNPVNVIIGMGQDIYKTYPTDHRGNPTEGMPVLQGVKSLRDINYLVDLAAGDPGVEQWYVYGREKFKDNFQMGGGCTAVMAPGLYTFLNTGQINGLMGGMRGAAEYEMLINKKGAATAGMDVQSTTHFTIIILVLISNLIFILLGRKK